MSTATLTPEGNFTLLTIDSLSWIIYPTKDLAQINGIISGLARGLFSWDQLPAVVTYHLQHRYQGRLGYITALSGSLPRYTFAENGLEYWRVD